MSAVWVEQSRALLGLRFMLFWRRLVRERQWGRAIVSVIAAAAAGIFSVSLCALIVDGGAELAARPWALAARGGPLAVFATWLTMALVGRIWVALMALGQSQAFLDPRRFRGYPVPQRLVSILNLAALFLEPMWLVLYPPLVAIALAISRLPGAPAFAALLGAEAFAVWATVGVLHLGAALGAVFDSRPVLRRGFSVALLLAGFAGFQLSVARLGRPGIAALFAGHHWQAIAWTPPGWTALLARSLSEGRLLHAITPALLLVILGLLCSACAHALSQRELSRPPEPTQAPKRAGRAAGWLIPLVPAPFSALLEKETKTVVRIGWLQLVLVPVAYLLLVRTMTTGPQPLLIAAVYANLGVLEISTNAFGRDLAAARAYFLWPVSLRQLFAEKNAVAYGFSAAIYLLLAGVALSSARVTPEQLVVGLLAHAAIFQLLVTYGNVVSVLFPMPVRGMRGLRRVRGAGPIGARLLALLLLAGAAWAPYAIAGFTGMGLFAAYLGALVAMSAAYLGLLGFCAHLLSSRRESLLSALSRDE
ncbi:MAG: hypothetical protein ABR567_12395 [Myxococcales bacterium]